MQDGDIQTCAGYCWRLLDTFIFRQKMSSSQRGITLWEHSKPADLQNNAVLIHAFVTSLNMKQHQTFQRSHHGRFSERDHWVQNLFYTTSRKTSGVLCFKTIETVDSIRSSCLTWKKETQSKQFSERSLQWPPHLRNPDIFYWRDKIPPHHMRTKGENELLPIHEMNKCAVWC